MTKLLETFLGAVGANALLFLGFRYWVDKELKRHEKDLEQRNAITLARFNKYNLSAVDAIAEAYSRLVDTHNAVFRFCFPDWDGDVTPSDERKKIASDAMVAFYLYFRKHQIFMDNTTAELFEKSFRFLQGAMLKQFAPDFSTDNKVQVGMTVLADLTKTLPGMLESLRIDIQKKIGAEPASEG